jgi:hypothetical protein
MFIKCLLSALFAVRLLVFPAMAQGQTTLSLQTDNPQMQTGQEYTVEIRLDQVPGVWLSSVEISYDPSLIYVLGTKSGSPVRPGSFFTPDSSLVVFNAVEQGVVRYTISQLAPADLARGSGVIGTFRIYPLKAGTTTLSFRQAALRTATINGEGANRTASDPQPLDFVPVLLELTVSGDTVEPPPEATATPAPTETTFFVPGATQPPQPTALVNVTAAPVTPTAATPQTAAPADNTPLLAIAIGAMIFGALGLVIVLIYWRRGHR